MSIIADLEALLRLNSSQFDRGILNSKNLAKKSMDIIKNSILAMSAVATTAFIGLGKAAINYTSDLKELENVLSVTFGDRMNAIALNADAMGRAMGRSSLQMRGMVAQAGALGKGLGFVGDDLEQMSINLAKTAVDMGSFFNVADDEAFTALRSALTGETEPIKLVA